MPTAAYVQIPPDSTGSKIDANTLTRGAATVLRQNISIADPATAAALAEVVAAGGSYALRIVRQPDWSVKHTPAAAAQATISKAAGAAGTKHVCTSVAAVVTTTDTAFSGAVKLQLRDGATGAGTIVWEQTLYLPVNTTVVITQSGLNIIGSDATAMTLESSAAGPANSYISVSMTGYDVVAP